MCGNAQKRKDKTMEKKDKIGLVLEGGGLRGAYTAGALAWLTDHHIEVDYSVGISSGAVLLAGYLMGNKDIGYQMAVHFGCEKQNYGLPALLSEGHYVAYKRLFQKGLKERAGMDVRPLREKNPDMEIGLYDLEKGETIWYSAADLDDDLTLLRGSCSLPIASAVVDFRGRKILDGGITKMIPIERALEKGCTKMLVITTKPEGYVRKPGSKMVDFLMRVMYPKYPQMRRDYAVRHINYYKQMDIIAKEVEKGTCMLVRPSKTIDVGRFKGDPVRLQELYDLGYSDMEARKEELYRFLGKE